MELTTLDPLGAFYLVALDADWRLRPQNINADGSLRLRQIITMPVAYAGNAAAGTIGAYTVAYKKFEEQQRVKADLHAAICVSLGTVTLNEINSKHQFGTGSLAPLDLVKELKAMFGNITKQEIDSTQALISARFLRLLQQHSSQLRISHFCWTYHSRAHPYRLLRSLHPAVHQIRCLSNYLDYS